MLVAVVGGFLLKDDFEVFELAGAPVEHEFGARHAGAVSAVLAWFGKRKEDDAALRVVVGKRHIEETALPGGRNIWHSRDRPAGFAVFADHAKEPELFG